jgi:lysophospholipase L1-like esterase
MHSLIIRKRTRWLRYSIFAFMIVCCIACSSGSKTNNPSAKPSSQLLPGQQIWKQGVSSFLFGTNDTEEWSSQNLETQPDIQDSLRSAGFTLIRSFFQDNASDSDNEQRIKAIENSGAHCLGVITNIFNATYDEHLVQYLGSRCLMYEFGNEPNYNNISLDSYLKQWNNLIPKLRHINPAAKFIGPADYTPTSTFMGGFLRGVESSGILPDAISFHWYPCYQDTESDCLSKANTAGQAATSVRQLVKSILGKDFPVGITEWNFDPGNPPPSYGDDSNFITSFTQTALRSMLQAGVSFACQFDAASYAGYGHLDMFNVETGAPKPQFSAIKSIIAQYRPAQSSSGGLPPSTDAYGTLVSRGKPVYCSANNSGPGGSQAIVNGHYGAYSYWAVLKSHLPSWCAIHVGAGPTRLLLTWDYDFNRDAYISKQNDIPRDYTISVSSDSTNGADGTWLRVAQVSGNEASTREHTLPFTGKSWVKMTVTSGEPDSMDNFIVINQIDLYNASTTKELNNSFFFSGDSITAFAYSRFDEIQPSFVEDVHKTFPQLFPAMIDGGTGGATSIDAIQNIDLWLSLNPDIHYWLLEWGTNDAFGSANSASFQSNLQTIVDKIKQAGHVPILADLPYTNRPGDAALNQEIEALNAVIDKVTKENGLIPGPNFYQLFSQHAQTYLSSDGIHPTSAGAIAMNLAWFQALRPYIF